MIIAFAYKARGASEQEVNALLRTVRRDLATGNLSPLPCSINRECNADSWPAI